MNGSRIYSVADVVRRIEEVFSAEDMFRSLTVRGEISGYKHIASSGHIYFTLKDREKSLETAFFRQYQHGGTVPLRDGMKVLVSGRLGIFDKMSRYELFASRVVPDGEGELAAEFERLKRRLEQEGLFAPEHKKKIPPYARTVGIVTSSSGAAIEDIKKTAHSRNPYVQLILCPTLVQGEGAAESIARAIRRIDGMGLDVLIVGRGGGSLEDLWAFNEEPVARAIYECRTPVISAVGHESDVTIADFAADVRVATPTAAAQLAVFSLEEFALRLEKDRRHLSQSMALCLNGQKVITGQYLRRLTGKHPRYRLQQMMHGLSLLSGRLDEAVHRQIAEQGQRVSDLRVRLETGMRDSLEDRKRRLAMSCVRLDGVSPLNRLIQGYAYVTDAGGRNLRRIGDARTGEDVRVRLSDGSFSAVIGEVEEDG